MTVDNRSETRNIYKCHNALPCIGLVVVSETDENDQADQAESGCNRCGEPVTMFGRRAKTYRCQNCNFVHRRTRANRERKPRRRRTDSERAKTSRRRVISLTAAIDSDLDEEPVTALTAVRQSSKSAASAKRQSSAPEEFYVSLGKIIPKRQRKSYSRPARAPKSSMPYIFAHDDSE